GLVESGDADVLAGVLGVDASTARVVASGLSEWRGREQVRSRASGWCYREWWKPLTHKTPELSAFEIADPESGSADVALSGPASAAGVWLVVVPAGGGVPVEWASSVVGLLGAGVACLEVEPGV
ncbi:hypothetical protein, partial [Streptomyces winkii]|uniref:hypothetical protein n=1 Tax=Streptomyces winkii TaxID=3051178 RepID=UPI0028D8809F